MTDFIPGEKVKFVLNNNKHIPSYHFETIPSEYIIHGDINLHNDYFAEFATVVITHNKYVVVRYKDKRNERYVQLGFLPEVLEKVFTTWKKRYK